MREKAHGLAVIHLIAGNLARIGGIATMSGIASVSGIRAVAGSLFVAPTTGSSANSVSSCSATAGSPQAEGDVLTLSPQAEMAANSSAGVPLYLRSQLELPTRENQERAQSVVQAKVDRLFAQNGIDTSQEVRLQVAGDGQVIVTNDHPQKAQIEALFKQDPELRNDFAKFSCLTSAAAAGREASAFQAAYARDPYSAVSRFSSLFSGARMDTTLSIQNGEYQAFWERAGASLSAEE